MKDVSTELTALIEGREGRFYRLRFSDGQELKVPVHLISRQAKEGERIAICLMTTAQAKASRTELAQSLLEEILNG